MILLPECFEKVPSLSYILSKHELPITYELQGKVNVYDEQNNRIEKDVEVFIGGYKTTVSAPSDFTLTFSSPVTRQIYVVIRYTDEYRTHEKLSCLVVEDGVHTVTGEFNICLASSSMES